jgi:hypothetical protein
MDVVLKIASIGRWGWSEEQSIAYKKVSRYFVQREVHHKVYNNFERLRTIDQNKL